MGTFRHAECSYFNYFNPKEMDIIWGLAHGKGALLLAMPTGHMQQAYAQGFSRACAEKKDHGLPYYSNSKDTFT